MNHFYLSSIFSALFLSGTAMGSSQDSVDQKETPTITQNITIAPPLHPELYPPIFVAIKEGNLNQVKNLLENGTPITQTTLFQKGILEEAILLKKMDILHYLLQKRAPWKRSAPSDWRVIENLKDREIKALMNQYAFDLPDFSGETPIWAAVRSENLLEIQKLSLKGARIDRLNDKSESLLDLAMESKNPLVFKTLIENNSSFVTSPDLLPKITASAIQKNKPDALAVLVNMGNSATSDIKLNDYLDLALELESTEILDILLASGGNINNKDSNNSTLLHRYVAQGNLKKVTRLLERNADVNSTDGKGDTPLHLAIKHKTINSLEPLISFGASLNTKNAQHLTPLQLGLQQQDIITISMLLANGADLNAPDLAGNSPLLQMIYEGKISLALLLLDHGANPNLPSSEGKTPLMIAAAIGNSDLVRALMDKEADPTLKDSEGNDASIFSASDQITNLLKKINPLETGLDASEEGLTCALSYCPVQDPVFLKGHPMVIYERAVIENWIKTKGSQATNPFTRNPISLDSLRSYPPLDIHFTETEESSSPNQVNLPETNEEEYDPYEDESSY